MCYLKQKLSPFAACCVIAGTLSFLGGIMAADLRISWVGVVLFAVAMKVALR